MATIKIEGKNYKVIECLGWQGGYRAKAVETPDGEKIAVKRGGMWTWWTVQDRIGPGAAGQSEKGRKEYSHAPNESIRK